MNTNRYFSSLATLALLMGGVALASGNPDVVSAAQLSGGTPEVAVVLTHGGEATVEEAVTGAVATGDIVMEATVTVGIITAATEVTAAVGTREAGTTPAVIPAPVSPTIRATAWNRLRRP